MSKVAVTIVFSPEAVYGDEKPNMEPDVGPQIQFMGKYFQSGQTFTFKTAKSYSILGCVVKDGAFSLIPSTLALSVPTHVTCVEVNGEWDQEEAPCQVLRRHDGCGWSGHVWSGGVDCGCNKKAVDPFTLKALGAHANATGKVTTPEGVTITWKHITEEEDNEVVNCNDDGELLGVCSGVQDYGSGY